MKRLIAFVLCILSVSLLLSTSLFAESVSGRPYRQYGTPQVKHAQLSRKQISALQKQTMESVGAEWIHIEVENPTYRQYGTPDIKKNWLTYAQVKALQKKLEEKSSLMCKHTETLAYHDTDTNKYGETCLRCHMELESDGAKMAVKRIETSAAIRALCVHEYGEWSSSDAIAHGRTCMKCGVMQFEAHSIVPADCENHEHCEVCGESAWGWEQAWGHDLAYEYTGDLVSTHTHAYCCQRRDNDGVKICQHVEFTNSCNFITYWDGESGGMHEIYEICGECGIGGEVAYESCSMSSAHRCWYCENPNSW